MDHSTLLRPPPIPHEHGAWAFLVIPLVLGSAAGGLGAPAPLLVWPAVVLAFFGRYAAMPAAARLVEGKSTPAEFLARRLAWAAAYLAGAGACALAAVLSAGAEARRGTIAMVGLAGALAIVHTGLALAGLGRSLPGEILGLTGLACSAPLVVAAGGHPLDGRAAGAGLLALVQPLSALAFVRFFRSPAGERRAALARCAAMHLGLLAGLVLLWRLGWLPGAALFSFIPLVARGPWTMLSPPRNLRSVGMREIAISSSFLILASAALLLRR